MTTLEWLEEAVEFINGINGGDRECPMCDEDRNAGECSENCCLNEMEKHIDDMRRPDYQVALFNEVYDLIGGECNCGRNAFECDDECCPEVSEEYLDAQGYPYRSVKMTDDKCIKGTITALYSALVERQYVSEVK